MTWKTEDHYFSGQGQVLLAARNTDGTPGGFYPVGDVSSLKISVATSVIEHKEHQTGVRGIDKRLVTETKCALVMVIDNFNKTTFALAAQATVTTVAAGTATAVAVKGYVGKITSLGRIGLTALSALVMGATPLVLYTNDATPWDYKLNLSMGSFQINDGKVAALSGLLSATATAGTVGNPTVVTQANAYVVGDTVTLFGATGSGAALVNGVPALVTAASAGSFSLGIDTTGATIVFTAVKSVKEGTLLSATYSYKTQYQIDTLTTGIAELAMRFEGLNTVEALDPVVVDVFKFATSPLKELALISDAFQTFDLEGSVLADLLQPTGSPYFKVTKLN